MSTSTIATSIEAVPITRIGLEHNGIRLSAEEFDAIDDWDPVWRYELIRGVVVVHPIPYESEADVNDELGYLIRHAYETPLLPGFQLELESLFSLADDWDEE